MSDLAKVFMWIIGIALFSTVIAIGCNTCNTVGNMANDGLKTVEDQYKPSAMLKKYEWFKDASAQLDNKIATIQMYEGRFNGIKKSYGADSTNRRVWSRDDREQWNIWESELTGIKASYNDLASQYNSNMAKFNYAFCNVGTLPQGATIPLQREYRTYLMN